MSITYDDTHTEPQTHSFAQWTKWNVNYTYTDTQHLLNSITSLDHSVPATRIQTVHTWCLKSFDWIILFTNEYFSGQLGWIFVCKLWTYCFGYGRAVCLISLRINVTNVCKINFAMQPPNETTDQWRVVKSRVEIQIVGLFFLLRMQWVLSSTLCRNTELVWGTNEFQWKESVFHKDMSQTIRSLFLDFDLEFQIYWNKILCWFAQTLKRSYGSFDFLTIFSLW